MFSRPEKKSQRSSRHALCMPCQVVRDRDFRLVSHRILDLSESGMLAATESKVLTGEKVIVSFRTPFSRKWVDAEGVVTRVVHGRRPGDKRRAIGVSFEGLDASVRSALGKNLRGLPPPLPNARSSARV